MKKLKISIEDMDTGQVVELITAEAKIEYESEPIKFSSDGVAWDYLKGQSFTLKVTAKGSTNNPIRYYLRGSYFKGDTDERT